MMIDKKYKTIMKIDICLEIFCLVLLIGLYAENSISLAYFLLLVLMVVTMSGMGYVIAMMYKLALHNKEIEESLENVEKRILLLEERSEKNYKKRQVMNENSYNILSITQSQLNNHIASVNTTMLVMSIVCVFITIAIPILNYAFLNAEQIENMYANVDEKMGTIICDVQAQVEDSLSDGKKELQNEIDSVLSETIAQFETEMRVASETTLFKRNWIRWNLAELMKI